jgi:pimeloyl-ACP methyl ester carboxylesterase
MSTITVRDGSTIYYKDWGAKSAQPIVFHHGWPLSADDWDTQMLYFVDKGYRVIAHDRRGHGRSSQVSDGHDMDHYAADAAAVVAHLDLRDAIHIGHSTGGGEATRYVARHGKGRVAKLVLIGAVPPIMVKTAANPDGLSIEVFDGFRQQLAANRAQFYREIASGPFYGYNRPGAKVSQAVIENWWHPRLLGDRLHRGPEGHRRADARHARRRRPDRPDRRFRAALREAPQEGHSEGLQDVSARSVHDARRRGQCRPSRLHQELNVQAVRTESVGRGPGSGSRSRTLVPPRPGLELLLGPLRHRRRLPCLQRCIGGPRVGSAASPRTCAGRASGSQ